MSFRSVLRHFKGKAVTVILSLEYAEQGEDGYMYTTGKLLDYDKRSVLLQYHDSGKIQYLPLHLVDRIIEGNEDESSELQVIFKNTPPTP